MIETGRYKKIAKEHRFCPFCVNTIESEIHFLIQCPTYHPLEQNKLYTLKRKHRDLDTTQTHKNFNISYQMSALKLYLNLYTTVLNLETSCWTTLNNTGMDLKILGQ